MKDLISSRITADGTARFSSGKKSLVCNSLQQVVYSIKYVITPEIVKTGYKRIGQYPVSFLTTMGRCTRQISWRDMDHMMEMLPTMVEFFRTTGKVTEAQMDAANILSVNHEASNGCPKDNGSLHQQRSVIMNSADCIAQYRSQVALRAAEPARRAELAEQREAARVLRRAKSVEARLRKEAKDAEKQRRKNLTPAELKAEDKAKRAAQKVARLAALAASAALLVRPAQLPELENDSDSGDEDFNLFSDEEIANISEGTHVASV